MENLSLFKTLAAIPLGKITMISQAGGDRSHRWEDRDTAGGGGARLLRGPGLPPRGIEVPEWAPEGCCAEEARAYTLLEASSRLSSSEEDNLHSRDATPADEVIHQILVGWKAEWADLCTRWAAASQRDRWLAAEETPTVADPPSATAYFRVRKWEVLALLEGAEQRIAAATSPPPPRWVRITAQDIPWEEGVLREVWAVTPSGEMRTNARWAFELAPGEGVVFFFLSPLGERWAKWLIRPEGRTEETPWKGWALPLLPPPVPSPVPPPSPPVPSPPGGEGIDFSGLGALGTLRKKKK